MTFGEALEGIKGGHNVARRYWNWSIRLFDDLPNMGPCLVMNVPNLNGSIRPWTPSHDDMLADDWEVLYVH